MAIIGLKGEWLIALADDQPTDMTVVEITVGMYV